MNVGELKAALAAFPDDVELLVDGMESGYNTIESVSMHKVARTGTKDDYDGEFDVRDTADSTDAVIISRYSLKYIVP